jgi:hypothetical protein
MIIVLKNADFSANNLGKVNIRQSLDVATTALLGYYSNSVNLSDTQKFVVDDFVIGLKANAIWEKLRYCYLPILASNLAECRINFNTGISNTWLDQSFMTFSNKVLNVTSSGNAHMDNVAFDFRNIHQMVNSVGAIHSSEPVARPSGEVVFRVVETNTANGMYINEDPNTLTLGGVRLFTNLGSGTDSTKVYGFTDNDIEKTKGAYGAGLVVGTKTVKSRLPVGGIKVYSLGLGLTFAEAQIYRDLTKAFVANF